MATNEYDWWNGAVKAVEAGTLDNYFRTAPITPDEPQSGRYKMGNKNKVTGVVTYVPVAYWKSGEGVLQCRVGDKMIEDTQARSWWPFCAKRPIPNDLYKMVVDHGASDGLWTWPSDSPAVTLSNNAPEDDTFEGISASIDGLVAEARRLIKAGGAKTQVEADQAADVADRLLKLQTKAKNGHDVEKRPHLEKGREVDDKWRPLTTAADIYSSLKQSVVAPFLKALKDKREKDEREARDREAQAVRDAEEAQRKIDEAAATGDTTMLATATKAAEVAEQKVEQAQAATATVASAKPVGAGTRGRAVQLRGNKVAVVNDWGRALAALQNHPDIRAEVQRLANASAKIGIAIDGTEIVTDDKAA